MLTSLVGRQRELAQLAGMLPATRLLTLAGTGGSGKTRLSIALASAARHQFAHGAWWAGLAGVTSREQLPGTVAAALGVPQAPGQDTTAAVVRHLRPRTALLVLDNCEQVVAGCAELVERLLTSCPGLTVVATSREMLGVPGERVFRVDGSACPIRTRTRPTQCSCSPSGRAPSPLGIPSIRPGGRRSRGCAGNWTGCRWPSSWPPRGRASWAPRRSPGGCAATQGCCATPAAVRPSGTRRCRPRWNGVTSCSASRSRCCSAGCRASAARSR